MSFHLALYIFLATYFFPKFAMASNAAVAAAMSQHSGSVTGSLAATTPLPGNTLAGSGGAGQYEVSLHAIISNDAARARVLDRLEAVCGRGPGEPFEEHVIAFAPEVEEARSTGGQLPVQHVQLRLSRDLLSLGPLISNSGSNTTSRKYWRLSQSGHPETRPGRHCTVRPHLQTRIEGDAVRFLAALGYGFLFEYVRRGVIFTYDGTVQVQIYQPCQLSLPSMPESATPVSSDWIVEASALSPDSEQISRRSAVLLKLKEALAGVAELRQVDHIALQQRIPERRG